MRPIFMKWSNIYGNGQVKVLLKRKDLRKAIFKPRLGGKNPGGSNTLKI
jgi:hypothetical protein